MGRIIGSTILMLCCTILLTATAQARTPKEVFLKDGGIIECQNVWQANGQVMILVNRDTLVDFPKDEVDLQKTFAKKNVKRVNKGKVRKTVAPKPGYVTPQAVSPPPAKSGVVAATQQKTETTPTVKPTPPAASQPAPVAAQPASVKPSAQGAMPPPVPPQPTATPGAASPQPTVSAPEAQQASAMPSIEALQ
jgi:hypothetical protein